MRSVRPHFGSAVVYLALAASVACSKSDGGGTTGPVVVDHMVFLIAPSQTRSGSMISPGVQVALVDASGTVVPTATDSVTLALAAPIPAGGALGGTLKAKAVAGVATFANLTIGPTNTGYTISASAAGLPTITSAPFDVFAPMPLVATSIAAGEAWSCAITASGSYCWGHSSGGELGINADSARTTPALVLSQGVTYSQMAAGGSDTCGLSTAGAAWCWGHDFAGAAGDGTTGPKLVPVAVTGGHTFTWISVGDDTSCGLVASGAVYCWGYNARGQLGDGTMNNSLVPDSVHGGPFSAVSAGASFTCALSPAGAAYCWGMNFSGSIGDGTFTDRSTPVAVSGGLTFSSIETGGGQTCALVSGTGAAYCWGDNSYGQLGDSTTFVRSVPTAVAGGLFFSSLTAGGESTCGIQKTTNQAYCWGHNNHGQLGDGTTTDALVPVAVTGGHSFAQLAAGYYHVCGLESGTGAVLCWGYNTPGQLGNGTTTESHSPTAVVP